MIILSFIPFSPSIRLRHTAVLSNQNDNSIAWIAIEMKKIWNHYFIVMIHEIKSRQALRILRNDCVRTPFDHYFDSIQLHFAAHSELSPISNTKDKNFHIYTLLCAITIDLIVRKCIVKSEISYWMCEKRMPYWHSMAYYILRQMKNVGKKKQLLRMTFHCRNSEQWVK